jgi:hypothetical protein
MATIRKHTLRGWPCTGHFIGAIDDNGNNPIFYENKSWEDLEKNAILMLELNKYYQESLQNMWRKYA